MNVNLKWQSGNYIRSRPAAKGNKRPYPGSLPSEVPSSTVRVVHNGNAVDANVLAIIPPSLEALSGAAVA